MGSFSFLKADKLTKVANIVSGKPFKFLIPAEFGGGYIKENYQDYGDLGVNEDGNPKYDMYELLAFWNADMPMPDGTGRLVKECLEYDGEFPLMKECDKYTSDNRSIGIDIGCYDADIEKLEYPLKLVSASYSGTYEECKGRSFGDPNQGWSPLYREDKKPKNNADKSEKSVEDEYLHDLRVMREAFRDFRCDGGFAKSSLNIICGHFRDKYGLKDIEVLRLASGGNLVN